MTPHFGSSCNFAAIVYASGGWRRPRTDTQDDASLKRPNANQVDAVWIEYRPKGAGQRGLNIFPGTERELSDLAVVGLSRWNLTALPKPMTIYGATEAMGPLPRVAPVRTIAW